MWPFKNQTQGRSGGSFMDSAGGFATVLAGIATVFAVPPFWGLVDGYIAHELVELYDESIAILAFYGIMIATYPLVFYAIRMSLMTTFVTGLVGLALRFA